MIPELVLLVGGGRADLGTCLDSGHFPRHVLGRAHNHIPAREYGLGKYVRPISRTSTNVEDSFCGPWDEAHSQLVVKSGQVGLMRNCKASLLGFVIGHEISLAAIASSVLKMLFDQAAGDRLCGVPKQISRREKNSRLIKRVERTWTPQSR